MSDIELKERRFESFSIEELEQIERCVDFAMNYNSNCDEPLSKELSQEIKLEISLRGI